jgi:hypothetical protein
VNTRRASLNLQQSAFPGYPRVANASANVLTSSAAGG